MFHYKLVVNRLILIHPVVADMLPLVHELDVTASYYTPGKPEHTQ